MGGPLGVVGWVKGGGSSNGVGRKGGEGWCPKGDPNPEEVGFEGWGFRGEKLFGVGSRKNVTLNRFGGVKA